MIEKLTDEQKEKITEYRERYFAQAANTAPADRLSAETSARLMAKIGGVKINEFRWVLSPEEGKELYNSLSDSFWASLSDSLWASLRDSLSDSLWASLNDSLWASLRDSLRDSGWLAYYTYAVEVLGISIPDEHRNILRLHNEIAKSCFALWIVPGCAILCERPASVEIVDGNLIGIEWRKEQP